MYNALIHCNWADNNPVQIRIEDDVMFISNSSMLPLGWTAETLMSSHTSRPLNPDIAGVFYRAGYIERWGRGIQKICDACRSIGADEPEYIVHGGGDVMVKFTALAGAKVSDSKAPKVQGEPLDEPMENLLRNRILVAVGNNPHITYDEMVKLLGVSRSSVKREIGRMSADGLIERVGGKRYGHWTVQENKKA